MFHNPRTCSQCKLRKKKIIIRVHSGIFGVIPILWTTKYWSIRVRKLLEQKEPKYVVSLSLTYGTMVDMFIIFCIFPISFFTRDTNMCCFIVIYFLKSSVKIRVDLPLHNLRLHSLICRESLLIWSACAVCASGSNSFGLFQSFLGMRKQLGNSGPVSAVPVWALSLTAACKYLVAKSPGCWRGGRGPKAKRSPAPAVPQASHV